MHGRMPGLLQTALKQLSNVAHGTHLRPAGHRKLLLMTSFGSTCQTQSLGNKRLGEDFEIMILKCCI